MPFCSNCGAEIDLWDRFCANCGSSRQEETAARVSPNRGRSGRGRGLPGLGRAATIALVALALLLALSVFSNYFVTRPDDVVVDFFASVNRLDFNAAVGCLDPTIEQAYTAVGGITSGLLGVDLVDVMSLAPFLPQLYTLTGHSYEYPSMQVKISSVVVSGKKMGGLADNLLFMIDSVANILGDEAVVYAEVFDPDTGAREYLAFHLKKFSSRGWRIMNAYPLNNL